MERLSGGERAARGSGAAGWWLGLRADSAAVAAAGAVSAFLLLGIVWVTAGSVALPAVLTVPVLGGALWLGFRGRPVLELVPEHVVPETMVLVPGGQFLMGSPASDTEGHDDERPQHRVSVREFLLWKSPLTRAEFRSVMPREAWPAEWTESGDHRLPANYVDFATAVACCNALSKRDGVLEYYQGQGTSVRIVGGTGYRLPSEAEWEYACRAGTTTRYWSGDREDDLARVGWVASNSGSHVHEVGEKPPSPFGLFDMHGNVWEWCEDTWQGNYRGAPADGSAWFDSASVHRVLRGGSFWFTARFARSAYRYHDLPERRFADVGFRPARSVAHP